MANENYIYKLSIGYVKYSSPTEHLVDDGTVTVKYFMWKNVVAT
jgi:hypothetical protein